MKKELLLTNVPDALRTCLNIWDIITENLFLLFLLFFDERVFVYNDYR